MQLVVSTTDAPGATILIPARSHTFVEIDYEIVSMVILLTQLIQEGLSIFLHMISLNKLASAVYFRTS